MVTRRLLEHRSGSGSSPEVEVIGNAPGLPRLRVGAAQHNPAWVPVRLHGHVEVGEAKGVVTSQVGETAPPRGGRRRKYYTLEPAGAEALRRSYEPVQRMAEGVTDRLAALAEGGE